MGQSMRHRFFARPVYSLVAGSLVQWLEKIRWFDPAYPAMDDVIDALVQSRAPLMAQRRLPNTDLGGLPKNRVKAALKLLGNL